MKKLPVILVGLLLSVPALASLDQSFDEIETMVRLRNYPEAVRRLQPLVQDGYPEAQYRMASLYRIGKGVNRNLDKATDLYRQAARAGHADAQYALAVLIEKSGASPAARSEARRWLEKSAAQGHRLAALKLEQRGQSRGDAALQISHAGVFDAIRHNDEALIDSLIAKGYDLNLSDPQGNTPVMAALTAGWPRLAQTLVANTRQADQPNSLQSRPLHVATARNYPEIVRTLLAANVAIDKANSRGETPLMIAVRNDNVEIARMLLERGAQYDLVNNKDKSAVDMAYAGDSPASRSLFASYGIEPKTAVKTRPTLTLDEFSTKVKRQGARYAGWPLLNIAIELGEMSVSARMIEQGPELEAADPDGNRALHVAARRGDAATLQRLVSAGAAVNATNLRNQTALFLAAEYGCLKCVALLLENRADQTIAAGQKITPLEVAVQKKRPEVASLLLESSATNDAIHRALLLALQRKMESLSIALIRRDHQLGKLDARGCSVLWHAADNGLEKTVAYLLDTGKIDIAAVDANGHSALTKAVEKGHVGIARLLIDEGADATAPTAEGNTALMLAVLGKKPELVEFLLTRGVDIDAQNNLGFTALMMAAASAQEAVIEILINAGANLQLRNNEELNAYQIAVNAGHDATAQFILEKSNFVFKLFN